MKKNSTLPDPIPEPEPVTCAFCGTELRHKPLMHPIIADRVWLWVPPSRCTCEKATEHWARVDEEERQEQEAREAREREIERRKTVERLFRTSQLPVRFQQRTFENFKETPANKQALEIALDYAERFEHKFLAGQGLIFTGTVGTGKTHLAAAITLHLLNQCRSVILGTVTSLLGRIRQTYDDDARETERQVLDQLIDVSLLVIDDLGKEKPTPWVEQMLYEIINARYEANKPLVITTNTSLKDIEARYKNTGPAIVSRIIEMCQGVRMDGADWRKSRLQK
ncbi:MAG: DNA replication protein DnaC [Pelotomaculum sp. PtaB.Bin104]|nr:MAG: DNA replication protein DnaC [Pelotomaculum sp. PtaB.Bin104]